MNNITTYLTTAMCPNCKKLLVINTSSEESLTCVDCKKDFSIGDIQGFRRNEFCINVNINYNTYKKMLSRITEKKKQYGYSTIIYDDSRLPITAYSTIRWSRVATPSDKTIQDIARDLQHVEKYSEEDDQKFSAIKVQLDIFRAIHALESVGLLVEPVEENGNDKVSVSNSLYDALSENAGYIYRMYGINGNPSAQEKLDARISWFAEAYKNNDEELIEKFFG